MKRKSNGGKRRRVKSPGRRKPAPSARNWSKLYDEMTDYAVQREGIIHNQRHMLDSLSHALARANHLIAEQAGHVRILQGYIRGTRS